MIKMFIHNLTWKINKFVLESDEAKMDQSNELSVSYGRPQMPLSGRFLNTSLGAKEERHITMASVTLGAKQKEKKTG